MYACGTLCLTTGDSARLYWTNSNSDTQSIVYTNIDGKDNRTLLENLDPSPYPLSIQLGRIFWSGFAHSRINSADKMTGSHMKIEFDFASRTIGDIHVFSSNHTVVTSSYPCRHGTHSCSHLCLPNTSNRGYRCACTTGTTLDDNTCNSGILI